MKFKPRSDKMKYQKLFVIVVSVCLMACFNVLSFAQPPHAQSPSDLPNVLANSLRAMGFEVFTDDNFVEVYIGQDLVELDFSPPNGITVKLNGKVVDQKVKLNEKVVDQKQRYINKAGPNIVECILIAVNIYSLKLDICEFETSGIDFLCIPDATFDFAMNILRCVENVHD